MVFKLSASSLKLMKDCSTCFWWQVKKGIRRPPGPMSQLPNRVERLILNRFNEYRIKGKLPPELSSLKGMQLLKNQKLHDEWKNKGLSYIDNKNNFRLIAKPDDVLENENKYVILDYKTTGSNPENCTDEKFKDDIEKYDYQLQVDVYNYVFRKNNLSTENFAYFLFIYLMEIDNKGKLTFGSKLAKTKINIKNVEKTLNIALNILKKENPPKDGCPFCLAVDDRSK
ncbi:MAG: PD-(D/E)XK nuclease family protein [Nanoarchaeota archaeon]|nr:PD-(D/E)XK nuclease family protein [Nanoarchaeota archaeon]